MLFISCFQVIFMQVISFSPYSSEIGRVRDVIFISQMKLRSFWQHFEFRKLISHRSLRILWISGPAGQWSPGQQHGPHLGAGCKCRLSGSSQNYLSQNLHFNKPPRWFMCSFKFEDTDPIQGFKWEYQWLNIIISKKKKAPRYVFFKRTLKRGILSPKEWMVEFQASDL